MGLFFSSGHIHNNNRNLRIKRILSITNINNQLFLLLLFYQNNKEKESN